MMGRLNPDGVLYLQSQAMLSDLQNQGYYSPDAAQRVQRIYKDYFNSEDGQFPGRGITSDTYKMLICQNVPLFSVETVVLPLAIRSEGWLDLQS